VLPPAVDLIRDKIQPASELAGALAFSHDMFGLIFITFML